MAQISQIKQTPEDFWKNRSKDYNKLNWVNDSSYLFKFVTSTNFTKADIVLDIGTGTGIVANALAPMVKEVIGIDTSQDMLARANWKENIYFVKKDIRDNFFHDCVFDKITARLVFHHIIKGTQKAVDEFYRLLKKMGR